jgi:probable phosphoglycerate mutase
MTYSHLIIEADGGSRGNPGPSGSGAVVIDASTGLVIREISLFIGTATNNVAEYNALKAAILEVRKINPSARVSVRMDSKLVIEQMSGNWKVKHPDMRALVIEIQGLVRDMDVEFKWIPREENHRADALANRAMDEEGTRTVDTATSPVHASVAEFNTEKPSSVRAPGHVDAPLTTIILVRHGRTHLTESKKISGRGGENPGLSELGREDAHRVAEALKAIGNSGQYAYLTPPSAIVASPIQRTVDTANIIANSLGLPVTLDEDVAEISFGDWDGHTNEEVANKWPDQWEAWRGSWTVAPPNGESLVEFDERVMRARKRITQEHAGSTVVVVAHVMPIRGFTRYAFDGGISAYWATQIAPCSMTILRLWGDQAVEVVTVNDTNHL